LDIDLIPKILDILEKKSDYVDIRINKSINNVMVMKDGKIQEITYGNSWGGCVISFDIK